MCKHQSCGMSKSSATNPSSCFSQNNISEHCTTSSVNKCITSCKSERCSISNCDKENCKFPAEKMAVGSHADSSSSSDKGYDNEQTQIRHATQHNGKKTNEENMFEKCCEQPNIDCGDYEDDYTSEKSPMLENQELSHTLTASSSWHNYQLSLQLSDGSSKPTRSDSVPGIHNWTSAPIHNKTQNSSVTAECDTKSVNGYLKLQEQESLFRSTYTCTLPSSENSLIDVSSDDNSSQYSPSRSSSIVQNWLFPKQSTLDEVLLHKNCISKKVASVDSNSDNFHPQNNVESELLVKSTNNDLSVMLSMKTKPLEFGPDTIVLQRRSSAHWEVSSIRGSNNGIHCRSFSLSPTDNFGMFETESSSETDNIPHSISSVQRNNSYVLPERKLAEIAIHPIMLPGSSSVPRLSLASSFSDFGGPICKICHMVGREGDPLISPCRCSGTMQFIHCGCLMKWLEISSKRSRKPPSCELCQYQYHWHKKFKVRHWQFPHCSRKDVTLHLIFFLSVLVMIACATITILCFKQDKGTKIDPDRTELTHSEIITLVCGVLFFLAFFVGMYVEIKARNTIYKLLVKFVYLNQQWYIDEYNRKESITVSV